MSSGVIAQRLRNDDPGLAEDFANPDSRARLVTLVAFGALRHAWSCWADADHESNQPFACRMRDSVARLETVPVQSVRV